MTTAAAPVAPAVPLGGPAIPLLVCGELLRGDDGSAIVASRRLRPDVRARADVRLIGQLDPMEVLAVGAGRPCVIVDAVVGAAPGSVVVRRIRDLLREDAIAPASSHALPPQDVLALADVLGDGLPDGWFVGIGGGEFHVGEGLSGAVEAALPRFVRSIERAILALALRRPAVPERPEPARCA